MSDGDEVRVIHPGERDRGTAQTPGMDRAEGVGALTVGAQGLWAGYVSVGPGVRTGAHHHGSSESAIYIISGRARLQFSDRLEKVVEAGPGDFIYVPAHAIHQEINAEDDTPVEMIVVRSSPENIVVNVDLPEAGTPAGQSKGN